MALNGLTPTAKLLPTGDVKTDAALTQLQRPTAQILAVLNAFLIGSVANPIVNGNSVGVLPILTLAQQAGLVVGVKGQGIVQIVGTHLMFTDPNGTTTQLDNQTGGGGGLYTVFGASGTSHSTGLVPDPGATAGSTRYLCENATWATPPSGSGGSGTVTSVALSAPAALLSVTGSPVTTSGTLGLTAANFAPNTFYAGPSSGSSSGTPTSRAITQTDLPTGYPVGNLAPGSATNGQVITYNGSAWAPATPSSSGSGTRYPKIVCVLGQSTVLTYAASGVSYTWTCPSTLDGQTVTTMVVMSVFVRLLSGTPGNSGTFSLAIAGNTCFGSRQLPTYGGGVNITQANISVNDISGSYAFMVPSNTIVVVSGGTFSSSCTFQYDFVGYYL